ncbi:ATP-binding protein [Candidatus Saccharibacteria bacterium]|nr:ATP-binding protein [Candidatus Saccharibacteria bacterium]
MSGFLLTLVILLGILIGAGLVIFYHSRKLLREQKNYERSLKMVPLLIHLPPTSDDIEKGSRDVRDVTDETISKAQIVYNIIASTYKKSFKDKFYGQRHFSFEIVGVKGFVYLYAAVPISMLDVVRQAIVSAYPSVRLEEVSEHNIFSPVGKMSGTMGGELTLKENYAYPIATYQDLKRDALQSVLNALSTLDKEDGAGIQIMMRPADSSWRKNAAAVASKKRKGNDSKKSGAAILQFSRDVLTAAVKPPEEKGGKPEEKKELSGMEQAVLDAIDDKTRYPGFEVLIRVVASSNISQRSQSILNNIVASFALFDAPGKNGFKFTPAKDIESFTTAYIMRFFPQENKQNILNAVELATLFHFPDQASIPTTQLERQASKQVDGPRNISEDGMMLGYNIFRGSKKRINLDPEDRRRHIYAVGQTGTGKSTFLENLALQDMLNGNGFAFIDPHGDVVENLMAMVPRERTEDVIYFNPSDMEYPLGLNMFEFDHPDQIDFLIQETIGMLYKLYDPQRQGIIGPRYEHLFRSAAQTVMADPAGGSFIDIPKLFNDDAYVKSKLKHVTDPTVLDFWLKEMPASQRSNEFGEVKSWFVSKFGAFLSNQMMRNIIGQTKSSFNLRDIMDNKKILLVNLSKGRTGELNSKLLGMIFVMKFQAAAMSRASIPEDERVDFSLYVDEFQNFSTDSFATILSEARKYRLSLIVANQFTTQLTEEIRDAVIGNIGTIVSFRVGTNDAEFLAKYFAPVFDIHDLQRIPNFNSVTRMLIGGVPSQPFSMATLPPLGKPNPQLAVALKQLSAAKFGRPRARVESEIFTRLRTVEPARPPADTNPFAKAPGSPFSPPAASKTSGGSFLDEWLAKRQSAGGPVTPTPFASPSSNFAGPARNSLPSSVQPNPIPNPLTPLQPSVNTGSTIGYMDAKSNNISSNEVEQEEALKIAEKLKQELGQHAPATANSGVSLPAAEPKEPENSDTISIDQDGNFTKPSESLEVLPEPTDNPAT